MSGQNVSGSLNGEWVWRCEGLESPIKKTLNHPKADYTLRREFVCKIIRYRLRGMNVVYLDESGFAVDSPRIYGYAEKGRRCYAEKDWHARGRVNAIGAIVDFVFLTVCLFGCNVDSDVFYAWLTKDLLPKVPPNSVIVMDNAAFHKRNDMNEAIENAGHLPEFLPPYSPDLNPIEHKWAQTKSIRRRERCDVYKLFLNQKYANL